MIIDTKYEVVKKLGDGHYATTFLVTDKETKAETAIKLFKKQVVAMSEREKKMFKAEMAMKEYTLHDNLIPVCSFSQGAPVENPEFNFKPQSYPYVQLEYVKNGELFHYLYYTSGFREMTIRIILRQIVDGLLWLKRFNLCHNDLKPENILIDEFFIIRLADYGFVRTQQSQCTEYISGTRMYTAPEINEKKPYNTMKADMFSIGVIMYLLMFRNPCFKDADYRKDKHFDELIKNKKLSSYLDKVKLSAEFKEVLLRLLEYDEHERISLEELNEIPYLNNFQGADYDFYMMEFNKKYKKLQESLSDK